MSKYQASVIIPTYNRSHELKLTLDSLLNQSIDEKKFEVIISDDGSKENIESVLEPYKSRLNIKYFFQEDKGFRAAAARNTGILNAEGEICIFLDNGVLASSAMVEEHIKTHIGDNYAVVGYVYGFDNINGDYDYIKAIVDYSDSVDKSIESLKRGGIGDFRETRYHIFGYDLDLWPAPWIVFWSCNISVKRKFLLDVGMFDETYTSWGGEDTDLALSLYINGAKFILNTNANSIHYPHEKIHTYTTDPEKQKKTLMLKKIRLWNKFKLQELRLWIGRGDISMMNEMLSLSKETE